MIDANALAAPLSRLAGRGAAHVNALVTVRTNSGPFSIGIF